MSDIIIRNLSKSFGDKRVLEGFDLTVPDGGICCIMGESGCGKSTLIKLIMGIYAPDGGRIAGVPDKIAAVFQEDRLCEDFSALTNVRITAARGVTSARISEEFRVLGLEGNEKTPARQLSGGMRRRVALIRAFMADAPLIILDEPFTGLDPDNRALAIDYVRAHRAGKTIILVTHDASDADALIAEQVVRM